MPSVRYVCYDLLRWGSDGGALVLRFVFVVPRASAICRGQNPQPQVNLNASCKAGYLYTLQFEMSTLMEVICKPLLEQGFYLRLFLKPQVEV